MSEVCEICGKICKNARGVAIHVGHMHKKTREIELLKRIEFLESKIERIANLVEGDKWTPLVDQTAIETPKGMNYGPDHGALMAELRKELVRRNGGLN